MKHTPGPWKIDENKDLPLAVIIDDDDGMGIAEIGEYTEENIANANLIAAAPDMLSALEVVMDTLLNTKESGWITDKVKNAIKKAKGGA